MNLIYKYQDYFLISWLFRPFHAWSLSLHVCYIVASSYLACIIKIKIKIRAHLIRHHRQINILPVILKSRKKNDYFASEQ